MPLSVCGSTPLQFVLLPAGEMVHLSVLRLPTGPATPASPQGQNSRRMYHTPVVKALVYTYIVINIVQSNQLYNLCPTSQLRKPSDLRKRYLAGIFVECNRCNTIAPKFQIWLLVITQN